MLCPIAFVQVWGEVCALSPVTHTATTRKTPKILPQAMRMPEIRAPVFMVSLPTLNILVDAPLLQCS